MSYNIKNKASGLVTTLDAWVKGYKEQQVEYSHDQSQFTLMSPDESMLLIGPARLTDSSLPLGTSTSGNDTYNIVGFAANLSYQETATVQPMKAIGSRRHIFAKSNAPVTGSISRLMILGSNAIKSIYKTIAKNAATDKTLETNPFVKVSGSDSTSAQWFTNIEEDLFRIPFGLAVVYASPATLDQGKIYAAEYFEVCVLTSRQVTMQTGQATIMENVSFMADRVVPFVNTIKDTSANSDNPWNDL
jgi:hypothetical protein